MENFCKICQFQETGKKLTNHIKKEHGLSSVDYTINQIYGGTRPACPICQSETRYSTFKFMKYCVQHSSVAESEAGRRGGKAQAWNKGKNFNTDPRIRRLSGGDNPFWGMKHSDETKKRISQSKMLSNDQVLDRVKSRSDSFEIETPIEDYESRQGQYLSFKCTACGSSNKKTLQAFERGSLCAICHPCTSSQAEIEIESWLKTYNISVSRSDRSAIAPRELDITIYEKKLAIEYDGLYWHSELSKESIDRNYHKDKTLKCIEAGWKLVHIFSDDWQRKKEIVKAMLLHKLGIEQERVHARKCRVIEIDKKQRTKFFEENHLAGDVPAKKSWGLIDSSGSVIAALSIRSPIQKKWRDRYELARFAVKGGKHVPGALTKLLVHVNSFAREEKKAGLISYSDRRHGEGLCYKHAGFNIVGDTGLDYWYTDGQNRYDRFSFRATKGMSEKQRANLARVGKIWGCGNNVWKLDY